ncbi:hypothetical protein [Phenylobacterium sp.]|uniref:hypothetical protein n=1 Tax=Phenylobacterium sp. TaxID=1871053 RepID=UPI00272F4F35|nr:hypothetical protein [Phenylobacterium sp.]MDP1875102.1 hypothetical protein [Phenylobacterium sp.]MDP3490731.1 hypothetical protein [Phenylobacterium sp.]
MLKGLFSQGMAEWGTASLVFVSGAMTGRLLATGMNESQALGALVAILGSLTAAIAVRIWPAADPVEARSSRDRQD